MHGFASTQDVVTQTWPRHTSLLVEGWHPSEARSSLGVRDSLFGVRDGIMGVRMRAAAPTEGESGSNSLDATPRSSSIAAWGHRQRAPIAPFTPPPTDETPNDTEGTGGEVEGGEGGVSVSDL